MVKSGEDSYQAKLTKEQAVYVRNNPDNLTRIELAEMFGMTPTGISYVQLGKTYENAGGTIRPKRNAVPAEQRAEIRRLRNSDPVKYTYKVLGEMFGVWDKTASKIVKESN